MSHTLGALYCTGWQPAVLDDPLGLCSPPANGSRSLDSRCPNIAFQPLSAPNDAISRAAWVARGTRAPGDAWQVVRSPCREQRGALHPCTSCTALAQRRACNRELRRTPGGGRRPLPAASPEPMEKVIANLAGARMIMGRKRKKAMARKSTPGRREEERVCGWAGGGWAQQAQDSFKP